MHVLSYKVRRAVGVVVATAVLSTGFIMMRPAPASAHCDSVNGPVVQAAAAALAAGDVNLALPYVKPEAEEEVTAAFHHATEVRKLGGEARELADRYFFGTVVRLHRQGEGAAYTGLKEGADHGPALAAADAALETGELGDVYQLLEQAVHTGVQEKYHAVVEAREHAAAENTVAAQRERAEAELIFEKYVYELYTAAQGLALHAEGAPAGGHSHGAPVEEPSEPAPR